jgi:hypothetical protein
MSAVGYVQVPQPSSLRLLLSAHLLASMLVILTHYKALIHDPLELIASASSIFGLIDLILFTKERSPSYNALGFIFGWSSSIALSVLTQVLGSTFTSMASSFGIPNPTESSTLSFPLVIIAMSMGGRAAIRVGSTQRASALVLFDTALLSGRAYVKLVFSLMARVSSSRRTTSDPSSSDSSSSDRCKVCKRGEL